MMRSALSLAYHIFTDDIGKPELGLIVLLKCAYEVIDTGAERPCYPLGGIRANILSATAFQTRDDRVANAGPAGKFPLRESAPCA
jgi:hypothetical protein